MIVFDDRDHPDCGLDVVDLSPTTDLRATFELRTGAMTTLERFQREWADGIAAVWAPASLAAVVEERSAVPVNVLPDDDAHFLCVNGRWSYPGQRFEIAGGEALVECDTGHVIAVKLSRADAQAFLTTGRLPDAVQRLEHDGQLLLRRPWDMLAVLPRTLEVDLLALLQRRPKPARISSDFIIIGEAEITIDRQAKVYPGVIFDAEQGPILIDVGAAVRPGATIIGPAYVGPRSTVLDRALIKGNTAIGPVCKVAGEVGGTIFQGYANKAHDGHLGDSYVGEWVNLGAGTTNSNLLNTYGEVPVRQRPGGSMKRSGMRYLGAFLGDHAKTAIGTRLMTGTVVGTGAMIACTAPPPECVPPFAWLTDEGAKVYRIEKFIDVARAVMARRSMDLSPAMERRLRAAFAESHGPSPDRNGGSGASSIAATTAPRSDAARPSPS